MAVVQLEAISKTYPGTGEAAVSGVSFTVAHGEFMVLLGPSGCGKSTTLRMIAGLETISRGTLSIDGRVVNDVRAKDRDIAMVFQTYALYPHMTVEDNLAFGLRRRSVPAAEIARRVNEAAAILGLSEFLQRKPFSLSGGQRQRVALGRAIVREPKVFLFDEPLSNLDAALRVNTRNELVKLHRRLGATMIYVTHDQVEAMTMGQRICVMNKGLIAQIGRPLEVYRQPADAFVARFLGNPPMNLLYGKPALALAGAAAGAGAASVIVGIRPEELDIAPDDYRGPALAGTLAAVEPLGAETLLLVDLDEGGGEVIARVRRDVEGEAGKKLRLRYLPEALYLFDAQTERAIKA